MSLCSSPIGSHFAHITHTHTQIHCGALLVIQCSFVVRVFHVSLPYSDCYLLPPFQLVLLL